MSYEKSSAWTDHLPNGDFLETNLNSSFDWTGIRQPYVVATENDALNGVSMLFGHLLTEGGMPVTMSRLNLVKGVGPALQIAEGAPPSPTRCTTNWTRSSAPATGMPSAWTRKGATIGRARRSVRFTERGKEGKR